MRIAAISSRRPAGAAPSALGMDPPGLPVGACMHNVGQQLPVDCRLSSLP